MLVSDLLMSNYGGPMLVGAYGANGVLCKGVLCKEHFEIFSLIPVIVSECSKSCRVSWFMCCDVSLLRLCLLMRVSVAVLQVLWCA